MDGLRTWNRPMTDENDISDPPAQSVSTRREGEFMNLRLARMTWESEGVLSIELKDPSGADLPPYAPGAHVDIGLPFDLVRQYSLCGDPGDRKTYKIAVRELEGGRASQVVHHELRPGVLVRVGWPRNNFPFLEAKRYVFVAGGIGITPLLPMIREAHRRGARWSLFYCAKAAGPAFFEEIEALGGEASFHISQAGGRLDVDVLHDRPPDALLYCCGPERLMRAVEEATASWPEGTVRFEWFQARSQESHNDGAFEVVCQRSGRTIAVPPDKSILQALTEAGVEIACSCQQGVCGTCEVAVVAGEVDHRDSILSSAEHAANTSMMTCVSRALGPRLVLDI